MLLAGCGSGADEHPSRDGTTPDELSGDRLPTITHDEPVEFHDDSQLIGALEAVEAGGAVYFVVTDAQTGERLGLVLPYGFSASADGATILDGEGEEVAIAPGSYELGGGMYGLDAAIWEGGPEVDDLWLAAPEFIVTD